MDVPKQDDAPSRIIYSNYELYLNCLGNPNATYLWEIHLLKGTELGGSVPGQDTLKKELGKFVNLCKARTWNQSPLSGGIQGIGHEAKNNGSWENEKCEQQLAMLKHITEGANLTKHSIKHSRAAIGYHVMDLMTWFNGYALISCFPCSRRRSTSATYSLTSVPYHLHALCFTKSEKSQGSASSLLGSRNTYVSASVAAGRSVPWGGWDGKNSLNWRKWVDILARGPSWWTLTGSLLYSYSQEHRYLLSACLHDFPYLAFEEIQQLDVYSGQSSDQCSFYTGFFLWQCFSMEQFSLTLGKRYEPRIFLLLFHSVSHLGPGIWVQFLSLLPCVAYIPSVQVNPR